MTAGSTDSGWTALHVSCYHNHLSIVTALMRAGPSIDPFVENKNGCSPIHLAISQGNCDIVSELLSHNDGLIRSKNSRTGWYPLHTAAYHMNYRISKILLKAGASVEEVSKTEIF